MLENGDLCSRRFIVVVLSVLLIDRLMENLLKKQRRIIQRIIRTRPINTGSFGRVAIYVTISLRYVTDNENDAKITQRLSFQIYIIILSFFSNIHSSC